MSSRTRSRPRSRAQSSRSVTTDSKRRSLACAGSPTGAAGRSFAELRKQLRELRCGRPELGAHDGRILLVQVVADRLDERQVGQGELRVRAAAPQDVAAQLARAFGQLRREAGLSHPGLAGEQDEAAVAAAHRQQRVLELGQLFLAARRAPGRGRAGASRDSHQNWTRRRCGRGTLPGPVASRIQDAERLRRLQALTDAALSHLELDQLLDALLGRAREMLGADTCAVLLLDEERQELVARAAVGIEEEVEQGVRIPLGRGFAGRVAAESRPVVLDHVDHSNVLNPILREKGIKSLLGVPLHVHGDVIGVLHVGTLVPRRFTDDDVELLQLAGDRAAIAIDHARAYEAERSARKRLEQVQAVTDAALAHLGFDELLGVLLPRIREILNADTCAVLLLDEDRKELVARAAAGLEEEVEQGVRIPLGRGFAGRVAAESRPVILDDVDHADVRQSDPA